MLHLRAEQCSCCKPVGDRDFTAAWHRARRLEDQYAIRLRKIAANIAHLVSGFNPDEPHTNSWLTEALRKYAETLEPWARAAGRQMITEVAARDLKAWRLASEKIGRILAQDIERTPIGRVMRQRLDEQVALIKSIPIDAAERVRKLTLEGITQGTRASEIAAEIMRQGDVSKSKATLIARTEVSRTATELVRARAEYVGSDGYIWRTAHDQRVRDSHHRMEGTFVRWDAPPTLDGMTGHAGNFPNCRCIPIPVFADD